MTKKNQLSQERDGAALPKAIRLQSFYSFYDDDNQHRQWAPGVVIDSPEDIALLVERQVEHEVTE